MDVDRIMLRLERNNPGETEFFQAVRDVLESIEDIYNENPVFETANVIDRLINPDRIYIFKIPWIDDEGEVHVSKGYRVQFNNALGPYKGGLRFHPNVNLSVLKFLGFEQVLKNSLTGLPLGAAMGGADFDPKGKSSIEIMRFCQSYMLELWKIIGPQTDVPGGDIGVSTNEIGYLYGMYKKLSGEHNGVLTGKGLPWGGSLIRPEAPGYGGVYFAREALRRQGDDIKGKTIAISGFGMVAWGVAKKAAEMGAKVVTISGPDGYIYDPEGISGEKIDYMLELRASNEDIVKPFSYEFPGAQYHPDSRPWEVPCDIAMPCATQNELDENDALQLMENGCRFICEVANMPCTAGAIDIFRKYDAVFIPGKAANAGGVAVSGLEMSQNAMKMTWTREEIDARLARIMENIHGSCVKYGVQKDDGSIDYVKGANIAGFLRVAASMVDQGVV